MNGKVSKRIRRAARRVLNQYAHSQEMPIGLTTAVRALKRDYKELPYRRRSYTFYHTHNHRERQALYYAKGY